MVVSLVILTVLVGFLGIVGNILCIIVLSRRNMRANSINLLLLCLAFWDIVTIIGMFGSTGFFTTFSYFFPNVEYSPDHYYGHQRAVVVSIALKEIGNFEFSLIFFINCSKHRSYTCIKWIHASSHTGEMLLWYLLSKNPKKAFTNSLLSLYAT